MLNNYAYWSEGERTLGNYMLDTSIYISKSIGFFHLYRVTNLRFLPIKHLLEEELLANNLILKLEANTWATTTGTTR